MGWPFLVLGTCLRDLTLLLAASFRHSATGCHGLLLYFKITGHPGFVKPGLERAVQA